MPVMMMNAVIECLFSSWLKAELYLAPLLTLGLCTCAVHTVGEKTKALKANQGSQLHQQLSVR